MAWNSKKQSSRTLLQLKSHTQVEIKKKTFVVMPNTYMLQTVTLIFNTVCYPAQCSSVETKGSRLPLGYYKNKATTSALLLIKPIHTRSTRETKLVRKTKLVCERTNDTSLRHIEQSQEPIMGFWQSSYRDDFYQVYILWFPRNAEWSEYFFMTKVVANAPANFKTVTRTIQFFRNQGFSET